MATLVSSVDLAAPPQDVWDYLVDWPRQGEWMPMTSVRVVEASADGGEGTRIEGWTGVGPIGLRDPMTVRVWEPPRRLVLRHHGSILRGSGAFEIEDLGAGRSRFTWSEWLDLPWGLVGRVGWLVAGPVTRLGFAYALRRLARQIESRTP